MKSWSFTKLILKRWDFYQLKHLKEAKKNNNIIIALDNSRRLLGYLLFSTNLRGRFIYIVHLCVNDEHRKKGIAKILLNYLIFNTKDDYRGIRVTCRVDYEATSVWEKLGFVYVHEKPGRSKKGTLLYVWWRDYNHPDLFTVDTDETKMKVVLDSNIVYDLMCPISKKTQNSHTLFSDWLVEDVEYFITDQLKNDVSHSDNEHQRKSSANFISNFKTIRSSREYYDVVISDLKTIYNKKLLSAREESDIRHLTYTITSDANYFLTKDSGIIKYANKILSKYSLPILRPEEFIIKFSSLQNDEDYQPYRLAGTRYEIKLANLAEMEDIATIFFNPKFEKKREFNSKNLELVQDNATKSFLISNPNEKIAYYIVQNEGQILNVKFLRYINNLKNITVLNQIIHDLIYLTIKLKKKIIIISEQFIDSTLSIILMKYSFIKLEDKFVRFVGEGDVKKNDILEYLKINIPTPNLYSAYESILFKYIKNDNNLFDIEKFLFPLKIIDTGLPCYIVPIQPHWAMNLFNVKVSEQDLFGGEETLLFNKENVYYRSAKPNILKNKGRILWYISKGSGKYLYSMSISASSYLNEVEIGKPKVLFSKHKRLGIYNWSDILTTANGDITNDIMAFSFDLTENFSHPININELRSIYKIEMGREFFFPQTPFKIDEKTYFKIYNIGMREI